jgi:hypothetical protein
MAHPHELNCQWCNASRWSDCAEGTLTVREWVDHVCPNKPPQTAGEGAAVAFGLMGMAEAIRRIPGIEACITCHKAAYAWVGREGQCMRCWDLEHRANPDRGPA